MEYMAILKVDKNKCIGCGTCTSLYPEFFEMGADGKARVIDDTKDVDENKIKGIISSCPMAAIKKTSDDSS